MKTRFRFGQSTKLPERDFDDEVWQRFQAEACPYGWKGDSIDALYTDKSIAAFLAEVSPESLQVVCGNTSTRGFTFGKSYFPESSENPWVLEGNELEMQFKEFLREWKQETAFLSSTTQIAMHPAYQKIIGLGPPVVPLLLNELERESAHLFWALKVITRDDPVPTENRGKVQEMRKAWLDWGRSRGLI